MVSSDTKLNANEWSVPLTDLCVQVVDYSCIKSLLSNTKTLRQIHEEALSLLKMFWRAALPSNDRSPVSLKKVCSSSLWLPQQHSSPVVEGPGLQQRREVEGKCIRIGTGYGVTLS